MRTAVRLGAVAINYVEADRYRDRRLAASARSLRATSKRKSVSNCVRRSSSMPPVSGRTRCVDELNGSAAALTATSRGSHIVLPGSFLPGTTGMMIPKTADGRVLFAIPWHGHLMVGTTDVAATGAHVGAGRRPKLKSSSLSTPRAAICNRRRRRATCWRRLPGCGRCSRRAQRARATKTISREHAIVIEHENLITVVGGKWTTYRKMALDALDQATSDRAARCAAVHDRRRRGWTLTIQSKLPAARQSVRRSSMRDDRRNSEIRPSVRAVRAGTQCRRCHCASAQGRVTGSSSRGATNAACQASAIRTIDCCVKRAKKSHSNEWP